MNQSNTFRSYLKENQDAFSLPHKTENCDHPPQIVIAGIGALIKNRIMDANNGLRLYYKEIKTGYGEIIRLKKLKNSKSNKNALVMGNGPSQEFIDREILKRFKDCGNEVFAVNNYYKNKNISEISPDYLVMSDPSGMILNDNNQFSDENNILRDYVLNNKQIIVFTPILTVELFTKMYGKERVFGFVDSEMRGLTSNIDPRFPRGYVSMTLFKALALALHFGYKKIFIIGMDNTYPRDIFCDRNNKIWTLERHAGGGDYLNHESHSSPSMDVLLQDIFNLFFDLRRCFSVDRIVNLDCYSLTDVFEKIKDPNQIEALLSV